MNRLDKKQYIANARFANSHLRFRTYHVQYFAQDNFIDELDVTVATTPFLKRGGIDKTTFDIGCSFQSPRDSKDKVEGQFKAIKRLEGKPITLKLELNTKLIDALKPIILAEAKRLKISRLSNIEINNIF